MLPIYSRSSKKYKLLCLNHVLYSLLNLRAIITQKSDTLLLDHSTRRLLEEGLLLDLSSNFFEEGLLTGGPFQVMKR